MGLKIAFGGKGGVGKTTLTSLLARALARDEKSNVIAVDADPVANMAASLGIPEESPITPISELSDFIAERTGATPGTMGSFFSLNPKVDDIPERFSLEKDGVKLLVMGTIQSGGSGCICPASTVLKALMNHLVLYQEDMVLMDMEAGVEHLGRATSSSMDALIIVVNPGARSIAAAPKIQKLGQDIGIETILAIGNRVRDERDKEIISRSVPDLEVLGFVPELDEVAAADRDGRRPFDDITQLPGEIVEIMEKIKRYRQ